jgi:tetratricopeptide (TPR) repeat protein
MMMRFNSLVMAGLLMAAVGCGGSVGSGKAKALSAADKSDKKDRTGRAVSKAAAEGFGRALDIFAGHDKRQDWNEAACKETADAFNAANKEQASATNRALPEAIYNAGLAWQRCGNDAEAKKYFEESSRADASFHRPRAQLALYEYARTGDVDQTISQLDTIIRDAKFQNVEALVALAALQMERQSDSPDSEGKNDFERAQRNLQRALAIDDGYMPAFNQLAIYYLEQARAKAGQQSSRRGRRGKRGLVVSGVKGVDVNEQQLDLAALVASQAQRKNPNYAPIHNTTGLILVELKNYNGAVKAFGRARQLDSKFFEAHMNYAAVNLSFRGFQEAEKAYRDALKLRPKEYEAHLGLALALRGQISDSNFAAMVENAQKALEAAKKVDSQRPETYYNEAILTQEFRAKRGSAQPMLEKAAKQYQDFIGKAGGDETFAAAVKRSKDRVQDIEDTLKFIREGEQAAKDEAARQAAEKAKKPAAPAAAPKKK